MLHLSLSRGGETRQATPQNEDVLRSFIEEGAFLELEEELFVHEEEDETAAEGGNAYLETSAYIGGGQGGVPPLDAIGAVVGRGTKSKYITVADEVKRSSSCGKTALQFTDMLTSDRLYSFIHCGNWLCPRCGKKSGYIHTKRLARILLRLIRKYKAHCSELYQAGSIDLQYGTLNLRQFVFTLPLEVRKYFTTRKALQDFCRIVERLIKKRFPGQASFRYLHLFGDKRPEMWSPHVNIHVFSFEDEDLWLTMDEINEIKASYVKALKAYILEVHGERPDPELWQKIDIHYSYVEGAKTYTRKVKDPKTGKIKESEIPGLKLIMHRITYMARPCPGPVNFDAVKDNEYLLRLCVIEMKGFHYITGCGRWKIDDEDLKAEILAMEEQLKTNLRLDRDAQGNIIFKTMDEITLMYRAGELKNLGNGWYKVVRKMPQVEVSPPDEQRAPPVPVTPAPEQGAFAFAQ